MWPAIRVSETLILAAVICKKKRLWVAKEFLHNCEKTQQCFVRQNRKTLATLPLLLGRKSQERKKSFSSLLLAKQFGIIEKNNSVLD